MRGPQDLNLAMQYRTAVLYARVMRSKSCICAIPHSSARPEPRSIHATELATYCFAYRARIAHSRAASATCATASFLACTAAAVPRDAVRASDVPTGEPEAQLGLQVLWTHLAILVDDRERFPVRCLLMQPTRLSLRDISEALPI